MRDSIRIQMPVIILLLWATNTWAEVTRIEITHREPYAQGRVFEQVGPYQRLTGRVYFAVDPKNKFNQQIIDLELAPRNAQGWVEFSADLDILAPVDLSKATGALLYDVNNRGNRVCLDQFNTGADEFLMRRGFVVVWSGWIAETLPGDNRLLLEAPVATNKGQPITGNVRADMVSDTPGERLNIAHFANQGSYEPTDRGEAEATLTWRQREKDPRVLIPRAQWRMEKNWVEVEGRRSTLPQIDLVMAGGVQPGYIYEMIYEAKGPIVQGLGLAGIRDLISCLKYDASERNPLRLPDGRSAMRRAHGFGVSQSGRALRMFLYDGFNADEQGRQVFDGLIPHVAGAGLGFFNHRFASPTRHNAQHDNHWYPADVFPFTYGDEQDPFTKQSDGILRRALATRTVPKIMHVQTSAEYWHRSGSLVHTDPLGQGDAKIPPQVRIYAIGGAQHGPGNGVAQPRSKGQLSSNPTDYRPILRALLLGLDAWVRDGVEPPASLYPRIVDGTLVSWPEASSGWKALSGVRYPEVIQRPEWLDRGPQFLTKRIMTLEPPASRGQYEVKVPAYGPDDNERGVLLLPSIAVPVASFTGWNLRSREVGAENELLSLTGGYIPFSRTAAARKASGDPRLAVLEHYRNFEQYLAQYTAAAKRLIEQRYLLPEELPRLVKAAEQNKPVFEVGEGTPNR